MISAQSVSYKINQAQLLKTTSVAFESGKFYILLWEQMVPVNRHY